MLTKGTAHVKLSCATIILWLYEPVDRVSRITLINCRTRQINYIRNNKDIKKISRKDKSNHKYIIMEPGVSNITGEDLCVCLFLLII